jgi:hypothetical protein
MAERRRRRVVGERDGQPAGGERAPRGRTDGAPPASDEVPGWSGADLDPANAERGLRGLVGGGSSQVTTGAALRARDAARPRAEDLARAEAELRIVRRNWTPRD